MARLTTFKFALDLTPRQRHECLRYAGASRKAFNWGLALVRNQLGERRLEVESGRLPFTQVFLSRNQLIPAFNSFKHGPKGEEDGIALWHTQVSKYCFEEALVDLSRALSAFFKSVGTSRRRGFPPDSLFAGVDLGINCYAVVADESGRELERIPPVKPLRSKLRKLRRASRSHSRKAKGSSGRRKSAEKLGRIHTKIGNQRSNFLHHASSHLVETQDRGDRGSSTVKPRPKQKALPGDRRRFLGSVQEYARIQGF